MLSIVIPTFNRVDNLRLTLRSLGMQSDSDFEIVIADDGSTDGTRSLVTEALTNGLTIRYISCGPNQGVRTGRARNIGAANVSPRSTHMLMFDSDLIVPPDFIAKYRTYLDDDVVLLGRVDWLEPTEHKLLETWMTSGNWTKVASRVPIGIPRKRNGTFVGREIRCDVSSVPAKAWREPVTTLPYAASLGLPLNSCYPMSIFWKVGGFDEKITGYGYQDMIFGVQVEHVAPICRALATVTAYHVWHAKSVPARFELEAQGNLDSLIRLVGRLDAYSDQVDWKYWWHYAGDRGGTMEADVSGTLWAVNYCRTRRLELPSGQDWTIRLGLTCETARSDLSAIPSEGMAITTSIDTVVLARKRVAIAQNASVQS